MNRQVKIDKIKDIYSSVTGYLKMYVRICIEERHNDQWFISIGAEDSDNRFDRHLSIGIDIDNGFDMHLEFLLAKVIGFVKNKIDELMKRRDEIYNKSNQEILKLESSIKDIDE